MILDLANGSLNWHQKYEQQNKYTFNVNLCREMFY